MRTSIVELLRQLNGIWKNMNNIQAKPLVSIIMSSYNHEKYIETAILSALNQTYKNIELIVVDDGSKDNSASILKQLKEKYNFYLEIRENNGLVKTLNYILKNLVHGKYVCVLDSDDYYALDKIEEQVKVMLMHPEAGLCYSPLHKIDKDGNLLKSKNHTNNTKSGYIFEDFFMGKLHIPDGGVLIPLKVFQSIGYYDEDIELEDYQLWFKILEKYPAIYLDKKLCYYRTHDSNVSNDEKKMLAWERQVIKKWENHPVYQKAAPYILTRWFAKYSIYDKKIAWKMLLKAIRYPKTFINKNFYKGLKRFLFYW